MRFGVGAETVAGIPFEVGVGQMPSSAEVIEAQALALAVVWGAIDSLPVTDAIAVVNAGRAAYDAKEAQVLAARLESGASARSVESLLQKDAKTSKRSAKNRTRRARAVRANPAIAEKISAGDLSPDQADVIATAADKTDGAAAEDDELIESVASTPPDQARKVADEWVREHTSGDDVQDRHDRQRRLRCVQRWMTDRDTHVLALEGDQTSIDRVEHAIGNGAQQLYRADGGRDLPAGQHPRTRSQRQFDAAIDLLTRTNRTTTDTNGANGAGSGGSTGPGRSNGSTGSATTGRPSPRATIVVTMTVDQATGVDPTPVRQVGGGLLAPTVLEELFCGAELVGLVTDHSGMPLWMGRTSRWFSHAQWLALIARDGGCGHCGAHYSLCEAHHIIAWEAPARGPTDIDNAVLVCGDCHHWIHDHDLILVRDPDAGTWTTRPARPHERAPKRRTPADPAHLTDPDRHDQPDNRAANRGGPRPEHRQPRLHEHPRTGTLW